MLRVGKEILTLQWSIMWEVKLVKNDCTEILCITAVVIPKWWFPNHCLKHSWKFYFISSNFSLYIIIIRMPIYPIYPTCLCRIPHPNWEPNTRLIKTHRLRGKQLPCITKGLFTHVMIHDLFSKKIMKTWSLCCKIDKRSNIFSLK